jgi:uncharacterized oxidoreductase
MTKIAQSVVLITGGSSGIRLAMAHQLSVMGARVVVCGRSAERLPARQPWD